MTWRPTVLLSIAVATIAVPCEAANWVAVRRGPDAMLSVDANSVVRYGDEVNFSYLVDFRTVQGDGRDMVRYRSLVVSARLRCKERKFGVLSTEAFSRLGGNGLPVARARPDAKERGLHPLEKDSSDEDLWRYICEGKKAAPLK